MYTQNIDGLERRKLHCYILCTSLQLIGIFENFLSKSKDKAIEAFFSGTGYCALQGGSFECLNGFHSLLRSTFLWCCLLCCTRWFEILSLWMEF